MNMNKEETLTLKLSAAEYERLIKMVYLGNWMINSIKVKPLPEYDAIEEKVLKNAGPKLIEEYDIACGETGRVKSSLDMGTNQEVVGYINAYDNNTFWEDLSWVLAERDLRRSGGKYTKDERFAWLWRIEAKYSKEFEKNGIENLTLVPVPSGKNIQVKTEKSEN